MDTVSTSGRSARAFCQCVDRSRKSTLIDGDTVISGQGGGVLTYQYADSGELVVVPNTWHNQPATIRANDSLKRAEAAELKLSSLLSHPPLGLLLEDLDSLAAQLRSNAELHRSVAAGLLASEP